LRVVDIKYVQVVDFNIHSFYTVLRGYSHLSVSYGDFDADTNSGGFRVGGARGKTKKGPSDDVIILSQPW